MTTTACPQTDQLKEFYLGLAPEEQSDEMLTHICNCANCQANLETLQDAEDSLIHHLRNSDQDASFELEVACEVGIARAMDALAAIPADESNDGMPQRVGDYEVLRPLGSGGMGRVYLARHNKLGRLVALKILAGHRLGDHRAVQRFEAEMRAVGGLSHPNIVNAYDARDIDGQAVLVTEYIDGLDLGQLIQRTGPLPIADACQIICQMAAALQTTSEQGFVHRDVKPSNIMLSRLGEVKLLDLGLARLQFGDGESAEVTCTGQTLGTADYISPEQVTDSRQVDVRSDIYSLGATFYKLLTGSAPFADARYSSAFAKMTAHVSSKPVTLRTVRPEVPVVVERLVSAMLSKRPEDRPQTPSEIVDELSSYGESSNLQDLASSALATTKPSTADDTASPPTLSRRALAPVTAAQGMRPIDRFKMIAAGFLGGLIGFCLGVVITINHANGTKTVVTVPDGTNIEIAETADANPHFQPTTNSTPENATKPSSGPSLNVPLKFALLVNRESTGQEPFIKDDELNKLLDALHSNSSDVTVSNAHTMFVRITSSMAGDVPIAAWNNGIRYALVSIDPQYSIGWEDIQGRIVSTESRRDSEKNEATIQLDFDEALGAKLKKLTGTSLGQRLGILIDNFLVQAPVVNTPLGANVQISGPISPEQLQAIQKASKSSKPAEDYLPEVGHLKRIKLQSVDAALAYRVLSHRFAVALGVVQVDEKSNSILVQAEPELMKKIVDLLNLLDSQKPSTDGTVLEVIEVSIDPQLALATIEKFFDLKKGEQTLIVDADLTDRKLIVRGTPEQIKMIKELMAKLGSSKK